MPDTQSIGLIGAGFMGGHYATALQNSRGARLAAVCDLNENAARSMAETSGAAAYHGIEAMLAEQELNAAIVATPDFAHTEPVMACINADLAVLCEKPLATTREDCRKIVAVQRKAGSPLMVNYGNRHRSNVRRAKQLVAESELGDVQHVYIRLNERLAKTKDLSWLDRTSPVWFLMSHCVDTVQWIIGDRIAQVHARAAHGTVSQFAEGVPDLCVAMGDTERGATIILESAWHMPDRFSPDIDFSAEIIGTRGALHADLFAHDLQVYGPNTGGAEDYTFSVTMPSGKIVGWWFESVRYFLHCLRTGDTPRPVATEAAYVTAVLCAIDESIASRQVVEVDDGA